jgi:hypothetical protein
MSCVYLNRIERPGMLRQFLLGGGVSICNIAIHAMVMTAIVRVAQAITANENVFHPYLLLIVVMIATVSVLMTAHIVEVFVWAFAYLIFSVAPPDSDLVYFAYVNFATLGYGDITPLQDWKLVGPITAMNGALLFGWSTAVIFEVLRKTLMLSAVREKYDIS